MIVVLIMIISTVMSENICTPTYESMKWMYADYKDGYIFRCYYVINYTGCFVWNQRDVTICAWSKIYNKSIFEGFLDNYLTGATVS